MNQSKPGSILIGRAWCSLTATGLARTSCGQKAEIQANIKQTAQGDVNCFNGDAPVTGEHSAKWVVPAADVRTLIDPIRAR